MNSPARKPSKPWRVLSGDDLTAHRGERGAYEAVSNYTDAGEFALVQHWENGRWVKYEEIFPVSGTCSFCDRHVTLIGGALTDADGTTSCDDTSAAFVPHKLTQIKEG
jgi:hypothetical protein